MQHPLQALGCTHTQAILSRIQGFSQECVEILTKLEQEKWAMRTRR